MEGPTNLGINLPLSTKPTNANTNSNSLGNNNSVNNNNDGGTINSNDRGEKKSSTSPQKKTNSNDSAVQKKSASMGYTCGDCQTLFSSREVYVSHMRREHGKVSLWLWWPGFCLLELKFKYSATQREVLEAYFLLTVTLIWQILKKHPCRQCEKSFSSSHSLCRHNRLKHKGLRKVHACPWVLMNSSSNVCTV